MDDGCGAGGRARGRVGGAGGRFGSGGGGAARGAVVERSREGDGVEQRLIGALGLERSHRVQGVADEGGAAAAQHALAPLVSNTGYPVTSSALVAEHRRAPSSRRTAGRFVAHRFAAAAPRAAASAVATGRRIATS